jgi:redox-sensing transcriptional repressor
MSRELGLTHDWPVVIVGIGNLGAALANYGGFTDRGFPIAALVDADPAKVGERVGDLTISHIDDLPELAREHGIAIGIVATPAAAAQDVADRLVAAGIGSVLNFAPAVISVPDGASLRKVDLAVELQILSFYQQRRNGGRAGVLDDVADGSSLVATAPPGEPIVGAGTRPPGRAGPSTSPVPASSPTD